MIDIKEVSFAYKRGRKVYSDLNLRLQRGSIVGLLGRNGEGKSTLLKLISGQVVANSGQVLSLGIDSGNRNVKLLQQVYMLAEEPIVPRVSVRDYFDMLTPFYPSYDASIADEVLSEFGVDWSWRLAEISLGQRKKALIALAISLRTPILLLDEPTNGLDIPSKSIFRRLLAKYGGDDQLIIISTHQVRDLEQLIDHIVMIDANRIVCNSSITHITERLRFDMLSPSSAVEPIYKEAGVVGEYGVWERVEGETDGSFSMELFFNAMIAQRERMQTILKK